MLRLTLALLAVSGVWAAPSDTIFPSDSTTPSQAFATELLEAVCPGNISRDNIGCASVCPKDTGFGSTGDPFSWSLEAVTLGHFLAPFSQDAVLWMTGCEPHQLNFGDTILLTKRMGRWSMLWYKAGVETAKCHKVTLRDKREILVCIGTAGTQGASSTDIYAEDLLDPKTSLMASEINNASTFFGAFENELTCGAVWDAQRQVTFPVIRTHIDKVEFSTGKGTGGPLVSVTADFGKKQMTAKEIDACVAGNKTVLPTTRSYRMEFRYDGHGYVPMPSSTDTVKMFWDR
jgi:hypothetical protein